MPMWNGVVGFWEEHQAGNAIAALRDQLAVTARVRRDGSWQTLQARVLVPGDLVHVELGQIVPADGRLVSAGFPRSARERQREADPCAAALLG